MVPNEKQTRPRQSFIVRRRKDGDPATTALQSVRLLLAIYIVPFYLVIAAEVILGRGEALAEHSLQIDPLTFSRHGSAITSNGNTIAHKSTHFCLFRCFCFFKKKSREKKKTSLLLGDCLVFCLTGSTRC